MWKDPIVEEVRANREKLAAESGNNPAKILEQERETLKHWQGNVVSKEDVVKGRTSSPRP